MENYNFKTTNIKGKEYVEVSERIKYLAEKFEGNYSITSEYDFMPEMKMFICKAKLKIQFEGVERTFTGLAQEVIGEGYINKTSALENCETSAVGRACAMAGIGIIDGIASVDEINKAKARETAEQNDNDKDKEWLNKWTTKSKDKENPYYWKVVNKAKSEGKTIKEIREFFKINNEVSKELEFDLKN
jgi:hypothetical protein